MLRMEDGVLTPGPDGFTLEGAGGSIRFNVTGYRIFLLSRENGRNYVLPLGGVRGKWSGCDLVWLLPEAVDSAEPALCIRAPGAVIIVAKTARRLSVAIAADRCRAVQFPNRPPCDLFGTPYAFDFPGGPALAKTLTAFYWDSILPMVTEKTTSSRNRFSSGFVVSTLQKGAYPGTYPDVDHEFQIKGRLAIADGLSLDVVRRMMELQIDVMRRDPSGQWRNPCAVQPRGSCEYHVPRRSQSLSQRAIMFLLTGNIEIIESAWLYVCRTKDKTWLAEHIGDLEHAISLVERYVDDDHLLWSDVYYEDQVIKDGRETIAQAFAANAFHLLSGLEGLLGRQPQGQRYEALSRALAAALVRPLPRGYWDEKNGRFVDWVDRHGEAHDHIHLLANELPLLFGYATQEQAGHVRRLLEEHRNVFWKFPSFVAAKIEEYRPDEIGTGGPYDLCAAGRYWCWDAAWWRAERDGAMLQSQLEAVAAQAQADGYIMGERYDMNYIYYKSEKNWHGAAHYYEYPNVFAWVLVHEYLGIRPQPDCDFLISPLLSGGGSVRFGPLRYALDPDRFELTNLGSRPLTVRLDLAAAYPPRRGADRRGLQPTGDPRRPVHRPPR